MIPGHFFDWYVLELALPRQAQYVINGPFLFRWILLAPLAYPEAIKSDVLKYE